jgi:hypothetical protein
MVELALADRWSPIPRRLALAACALILALMLGRLWWLPAHAPLNVNEGWNAGHVARAFGAGSLYPAPDALIANNYPPLSFAVVGAAGRLIGDPILAGRIVSLLSQIATGAAVYAIVARIAGARRVAMLAALLFAGLGVTVLRKYLAMNDPQWLGQAMMAWALMLLVPHRPGERAPPWRIVAAAALTVAGGLVKHNLVAVPLAATLWLWFTDRRALWIWVSAGAATAIAACATLFAIWGSDIFADVLAPARSYSPLRMLAHGAPLLLFVLPGLLACRPLLGARRHDPRLLLPLLLLAVAIPTAILQRSGDGVDINAIFDTAFALAIAVPLGCALRTAYPWRWLGVAVLPTLVLVPVAAIADARELAGRDATVQQWQPFITRIAAAPGPVACDDQAICHWAGRVSAMDFFALKQRLLKGDSPALKAALDRRAFAMIAMRSTNPGWHENRLIPPIRTRYRTVYAEGGFELLVPR